MYWNKKRIITGSILTPLMLAFAIGLGIGNKFLYSIEGTITGFLCPPVKIEQLSDNNAAEGFDLAKQVVQEGAVLVKNDDNTLPLNSSNKKINVFGHGSVDWIIGGSGSGQVIKESGIDNILFFDALDHYGVEYNTELKDMYTRFYAPIGTADSLHQFYQAYYKLYEPSISDTSYYTSSLLNNAKNFSDTALVVISRRAGETNDPPREQYKAKPVSTDSSRHYLEISTEEEGMLRYVGENYNHVVVIINSTNAMELDFLKTIPGLDACLIVGATGTRGAEQIPYILYGDNAYPSGRTVDTYPYSFKYNVNYGYTGLENIHHYANGSNLYPHGVSRNAGVEYTDSPSYVDYAEGIYVGYKWFETADAEGYWDNAPYNGYDNVVQFPFGYGLSYTTFSWEVTEISPAIGSSITNETEISIKVNVKNTGEFFKGKDVVEAYITAPYTPGGIEKSYVSLVGVQKTIELAPGEESVVELKINAKEFESYDCYDANNNGFKGYELEEGTYQLKLMSNAHTIKKVKMNGSSDVDAIINYEVDDDILVRNDEVTGNDVKNRFTGEDAEGGVSIDGSDSNSNINYIHRNKFNEINLDTFVAPSDRDITPNVSKWNIYDKSEADEWDNRTTDIFGNPIPNVAPSWNVDSGNPKYKLYNNGIPTELGLKLGKDYDDPDWESVLDSITFSEAVSVLNSGSFGSSAMSSIGKPKTYDYDGPSQVRSFNAGSDPGTGFPCASVVAQTFSTDLAYKFGLNYGKEMSAKGVDGAYAFGCNIHRSPFQGRNYEYLSEDGMLSGLLLSSEVRGLYNTGKYSFLKHLVVAECEHEREAMYTWLTEQSLREIYLKPFQIATQTSHLVGIMSSYNRLGGIWTGGSEHLIEGVLRHEWGFKGAIDTDYADHPQFMNGAHSLRAGGNLCMATSISQNGHATPTTSSGARIQLRMREAVKQILFMTLTVKYQNQQYNINGDPNEQIISYQSLASWVWWKPALTALDIAVGAGILIGLYLIFVPKPKKETKPNKEAK